MAHAVHDGHLSVAWYQNHRHALAASGIAQELIPCSQKERCLGSKETLVSGAHD